TRADTRTVARCESRTASARCRIGYPPAAATAIATIAWAIVRSAAVPARVSIHSLAAPREDRMITCLAIRSTLGCRGTCFATPICRQTDLDQSQPRDGTKFGTDAVAMAFDIGAGDHGDFRHAPQVRVASYRGNRRLPCDRKQYSGRYRDHWRRHHGHDRSNAARQT